MKLFFLFSLNPLIHIKVQQFSGRTYTFATTPVNLQSLLALNALWKNQKNSRHFFIKTLGTLSLWIMVLALKLWHYHLVFQLIETIDTHTHTHTKYNPFMQPHNTIHLCNRNKDNMSYNIVSNGKLVQHSYLMNFHPKWLCRLRQIIYADHRTKDCPTNLILQKKIHRLWKSKQARNLFL